MISLPILLASLAIPALASPFPESDGYTDLIELTPWEELLSQPIVSKRQATTPVTFPVQCNTQCAQSETALNGCSNFDCFCTATNIVNLRICFNCVGDVRNNVPALQELMDSFVGNCSVYGHPVPSQTVTGGGGGVPITTTSISRSTTLPGTTTTPFFSTSTGLPGTLPVGGDQTTKPIFSPVITTEPTTTSAPTTPASAAVAATPMGIALSLALSGLAFALGVL